MASSTRNAYAQRASFSATGKSFTFSPSTGKYEWQLRLINLGAAACDFVVETIDVDAQVVQVDGSPFTVNATSGKEFTFYTSNRSLRVTTSSIAAVNAVAKVLAWGDGEHQDPGTYGTLNVVP